MSNVLDTELNETPQVQESAVEIDLDSVVEVENPEADFNVPAPPPPKGEYVTRWKLNAAKPGAGIEAKHSEKVGNFLNVHLTGAIVAPDEIFDGYLIGEYFNSIVNRQKGTSEVHHFLNCIGTPAERSMSLRSMMEKLRDELSVEPTSKVKIDWKAGAMVNGKWQDFVKTMTAFPKLPEAEGGGYQNFIISPVDGEKLYATAYVVQHLPPNT